MTITLLKSFNNALKYYKDIICNGNANYKEEIFIHY